MLSEYTVPFSISDNNSEAKNIDLAKQLKNF